jgi:hypothetical protein
MSQARAGRGAWQAAAGAGALVFAACAALVAALPGDAYWINDCGSKALLAERLWASGFRDAHFSWREARADPAGRFFPIPPPFALPHAGGFLSTYPPAYAALAAPALAAFGPRGLRLPAALGAAACAALFALWAAPALGRRSAFAGALLLGLASPLLFYGVTVWEHSLTVALVLAASLCAARGRAAHWAAAGAALGAACWLREELALALAAFAAAALLGSGRRARVLVEPGGPSLACGSLRGGRLSRVGLLAAGAALPGAALLAFNALYFGHPLGGHVLANLLAPPAGAAAGRLDALAGLLGGFGHSAGERALFAGLGLGLPLLGLAAAGRAARAGPRAELVLSGALALAALLAWGAGAWRQLASASPLETLVLHNGLLLQWPLAALAGLGLFRVWRDPAYTELRRGLAAGVFFAGLVVCAGVAFPTSYGAQVGAGVHFGPRVLLPALPALLLLALAAAQRGRAADRLACALLAAAGLASALLALGLLREQQAESGRVARALRALPPAAVVTSHPFLPQHLAGLWDAKSFLLAPDPGALHAAAAALARAGAPAWLVALPAGSSPPPAPRGAACRLAAQPRGRLRYVDLDVYRCDAEGARGL